MCNGIPTLEVPKLSTAVQTTRGAQLDLQLVTLDSVVSSSQSFTVATSQAPLSTVTAGNSVHTKVIISLQIARKNIFYIISSYTHH